ncbi:hypothetical protein ACUNGW_19675, partial [Serratia sp. IR-2025]
FFSSKKKSFISPCRGNSCLFFYIAAVWQEINRFFSFGCPTAQPERKLLILPAIHPCPRSMAV